MKIGIVGGGIAGLASGWALTKRGCKVTLFEQGPVPNPLSASGDHHRIIRRAYGKLPGYGQMIDQAFAAWQELWGDIGAIHYDARGFMAVSRRPGDEADEYHQGLKESGHEYTLLNPDQATNRFPFLAPGQFDYAFTSPDGGALHCLAIAQDVANWLQSNGARLITHTKVSHVDCHQGTLNANGQTHTFDKIVVCAGAWAKSLLADTIELPEITPFRTAVVYLKPPADLAASWARAPVILDVGGDTDGYIIPPSGAGGLKFGCGLHKVRQMNPDENRESEAAEGEIIRNHFSPPLARLHEYEVQAVQSCVYTFTQDLKYFAKAAGRALVVSACSGHGYKFGPAVGQQVADYVFDEDFDRLYKRLRAELLEDSPAHVR